MIKYVPLIDESLTLTTKVKKPQKLRRLIVNREEDGGKYGDESVKDRDVYVDYKTLMESKDWKETPC